MALDPNTLYQEANCLGCNSNASMAEMLMLALLQRMVGGGGGTGGAGLVGTGSPQSVVVATEGTSYYDRTGFAYWYKTVGSDANGWTQVV